MRDNGPCAAKCGALAERTKLMCPGCWAKVPRDLQHEVYRTWRNYGRIHRQAKKLPPGTPNGRRTARDAYAAALEAAVTSVWTGP